MSKTKLSKSDFLEICSNIIDDHSPYKTLMEAFSIFDAQGTGKISQVNLKKILDKISDNEFEELVNILEFDDKGLIRYADICQFFTMKY